MLLSCGPVSIIPETRVNKRKQKKLQKCFFFSCYFFYQKKAPLSLKPKNNQRKIKYISLVMVTEKKLIKLLSMMSRESRAGYFSIEVSMEIIKFIIILC